MATLTPTTASDSGLADSKETQLFFWQKSKVNIVDKTIKNSFLIALLLCPQFLLA